MEKYISKKEKASYGFAAVGSYMVAGITQSYLMYFFTDILIIPSAFVMMLMIVARVWDALNDPMMGVIVDRTSTKYGKMRPYVLIGSFLMLVTTIVLFMPLTGAPTMFKMIFAAVSYIIGIYAYRCACHGAYECCYAEQRRESLASVVLRYGRLGR